MESVAGIVISESVEDAEAVSSTRAACSDAGGYVTGLVASVVVLAAVRWPAVVDESVSVEGFSRPLVESFE
jgi:hypothetical protein